jgi:hypothetical protein
MGEPLTDREPWTYRILVWSDWLLLMLAFLLAWFLIGTPAVTKAWPVAAQFLYRVAACTTVVAGILTLRWRPPVGFVITFAAYGLVAAEQVFSSNAMWLALAGLLVIGSVFFAEAMSRFRKTSGENETTDR